MRNIFCSKLGVLGITGTIACSPFSLSADARRAYDSSGSALQSSPPQNSYSINQFSPPGATNTNANTAVIRQAPMQSQSTPTQSLYKPTQS